MDKLPLHLLVAVGSRRDQTCSIGAFARAEGEAMRAVFESVEFVEPDAKGAYPVLNDVKKPDVVFYHSPALVDRGHPLRALVNALKIRARFPRALFIPIVHELSEAPLHWRVRQFAIARLSGAAVANTVSDFQMVSKFSRRTLRSRLGPTLERADLKKNPAPDLIAGAISEARNRLARERNLDPNKKWVLHPGLVTHGKGADALDRVAAVLRPDEILIVMGGFGPKEADRDFARMVLGKLERALSSRFAFISDANDGEFSAMLTAADLVVLPYDMGVSERRSSFLSAASCGADIWTTIGEYSGAMELPESGAMSVSAASWSVGIPGATASLRSALDERYGSIERRVKNLEWSKKFDWDLRAKSLARFIEECVRKDS